MRKLTVLLAFCFVVGLSADVLGQTTKRGQLIKFAKALEQTPFGETAKDDRAWAVQWVIETDEVSVIICSNPITAPFLEKKNKYGSELIAQYTIAMAAFKLESGSTDEDAAQLSGIESALRAYQSMLTAKPKARFKGMDDLIAMRDRGELTKESVAGCGKKDSK